jgi:hypothetical protein
MLWGRGGRSLAIAAFGWEAPVDPPQPGLLFFRPACHDTLLVLTPRQQKKTPETFKPAGFLYALIRG